MKECKVIHINDGSASVLKNRNFHFVEQFDWTESYLNQLLREGWEVRHMVPEVTPAIQRDGSYNFYKSGFTFYLEREKEDGMRADDDGAYSTEEVVDFGEIEFDDDFIADFFTIDESGENN